jgi:replicative DNA helicase
MESPNMTSSAVVLDKGLPANLDAERFVLGSILLDDSYYIQTAGALEADDFSIEKHRRIFLRMGEIHAWARFTNAASESTASRSPTN